MKFFLKFSTQIHMNLDIDTKWTKAGPIQCKYWKEEEERNISETIEILRAKMEKKKKKEINRRGTSNCSDIFHT